MERRGEAGELSKGMGGKGALRGRAVEDSSSSLIRNFAFCGFSYPAVNRSLETGDTPDISAEGE